MDATADTLLASDFATLSDLIAAHARERPDARALVAGDDALTYAQLDRRMDDIAAALQSAGIGKGQAVALLGAPSIPYATAFLASLRAGAVPTPLAPSATSEQLRAMVADSGAGLVFADADGGFAVPTIRLDDLDGFAPDAAPRPVTVAPSDPFNIIYSSGTTGTPKGIVQSHAMRWAHIRANVNAGFGEGVTMIATPLYSNTTLVAFLPTLAYGGTAVLLPKFDAVAFLQAAERHRATHAMLVPVQFARIMAVPDFDRYDLSAFRLKTSTSAPFAPTLKADVLARWPGLLVEYYGMTEGGGTCMLIANAHPDKLHTVGRPVEGCDIRLIDDDGNEVRQGEVGEVVGRSGAMMSGYHGRDGATRDATWHDADGNAYIRHGDVGRFDADGFLTLLDRKKDLIISGGFNIYPADLEAELRAHPDVADASVVGVPSVAWGETPVAWVVPRDGAEASAEDLRQWFNTRVGKTQRLAEVIYVDELPRSSIGKVLKRELRDRWSARA